MLCFAHRLDPAVQSLQRHIENDAELIQLFGKAFSEIPEEFLEDSEEHGHARIRNYSSLITAIDQAIKTVPWWSSIAETQCIIAFPINEAMIWFMNTRTGSQILSRKDINAHFLAILQKWGQYLSSPDSATAIHDRESGWVSKGALKELLEVVNNAHNTPFQASSFEEAFICEPSLPSYGFRSWDDFFTRQFRPPMRPIASPEDDRIIINPCESQPFALMNDVPAETQFSLKGTTYSLQGMLDNDPHASTFPGGTVFQGWLSAFSYHRWHAPVAGTVVKVLQIPGTYFAADPSKGFENIDHSTGRPSPDRQAPDASLQMIASIATRTAILIRADNEALGTVGFLAIGMADVSSCVSTVSAGDHVFKGQEIGSFHYGGSSFCLLFQPGVNLHFSPLVDASLARTIGITGRCIAVNSQLASL
ncbi:hypothetical protein P175DRAFT_0493462 [Aspergillus ochraceoroseus IBT 24754]|uniref:L-tryptophan decarboxylase PsiD-like domain-containing protein n=2 Tax=Aspergillus ochraceoroseus TaxID=138278 RepID=A0A2T5LY15_9EURO|nr:uncharacterized protein P175DRAFT_0493462 [Aspergillus ochraceoroseus IBT 24754]KKK18742.1 hypothetical protein AOCH_000575 [Aspergillus ochraceoroseus]PTU21175.1 hypothetical protein P175DRAFT_0493462 [Aspergillus ochraceoroseus IBT 24754]